MKRSDPIHPLIPDAVNLWNLLLALLLTALLFAPGPLAAQEKRDASFDRKQERARGKEKNLAPAEKRQIMKEAPQNREMQQRLARRLYDRENKGRLDESDIKDMARDRVLRWDLNGDGHLDQYELRYMRNSLAAEKVKSSIDTKDDRGVDTAQTSDGKVDAATDAKENKN